MPKFTGKAKDFALWKKLWQEGISPQFEEGAQMMAFTTCLPEKVWKKIGRLDNVTRVWDELDRHYGAPKIVRAEVMTELEQFGVERDKPEFSPRLHHYVAGCCMVVGCYRPRGQSEVRAAG